ncbi:DNA replication/repair protein RecF [Thiolapillus sp.]
MKITHIRIQNLRILQDIEFLPAAGLNVITGDNGAGKTSILEAIYLLGQGKSFRHTEAGPLIRKGKDSALVVADIQNDAGVKTRIGIQRSKRQFVARHAGQDIARRSELFRLLPLLLITPQSHELIERGPELRRRFLDFGLFHVEQSYHQVSLSYHRALKQRNSALRSGDIRLARSFNEQLIANSSIILQSRQLLSQAIETYLVDFLSRIGFKDGISLHLYQGWKGGMSLEEALRRSEDQDLKRGFTSAGVHRSQLKILTAGSPVDKVLSRGQQKLLVYGLVLALCELMKEKKAVTPLLLIDDISAELDTGNAQKVLDYLRNMDLQLFITALDFTRYEPTPDTKVFHVEHGKL